MEPPLQWRARALAQQPPLQMPAVIYSCWGEKYLPCPLDLSQRRRLRAFPSRRSLPWRPPRHPLPSPPSRANVDTAERRLRLSSPWSDTSAWAAGLLRRRHADLGFQRGTGLGPGSAAHRRGWPARGGGVPRTRRGGEFICRSISSPQLPSPFRRRFRRRLLPALDQHGVGKRRSLGCRFLYQVSRLSCRDVE